MPPSAPAPDADRFAAHLDPLQDSLVAFAKRVTWSRSDAEDVLQTALATAYARFGAFEEGTNFRAWIFKHLRFAAWAHNRREHAEGDTRLDDDTVIPPVEATSTATEAVHALLLEDPDRISDEFDEFIQRALRTLSDRERSVLLLRTIGDFAYREIADIMEIPIGSVMAYLSRARAKMRETLAVYARRHGWEPRPDEEGEAR